MSFAIEMILAPITHCQLHTVARGVTFSPNDHFHYDGKNSGNERMTNSSLTGSKNAGLSTFDVAGT